MSLTFLDTVLSHIGFIIRLRAPVQIIKSVIETIVIFMETPSAFCWA